MRGGGGGARDQNSPWRKHTIQRPVSTKPPVPAGDPEYEQSQPINRDDRRAMLRSYFRTRGLSEAQIDEQMRKSKV
jgi:hypothetical protein